MYFLTGQEAPVNPASKTLRIGFYNVENLFDTIDDPAINDASFLPDARIPWTTSRYAQKLDHLAEVIYSLSDGKPLAILGLCEVENAQVLNDLVRSPQILPYQYKIVHHEGPDERGIDNALLYDANQFEPLYSRGVPVILHSDNNDRTRDILYVKGLVRKSKKDTLHIFVNHWPSRYGGREASEPKRIRAAKALKEVTDSLLQLPHNPLVIAMGDFNDEPADISMVETLKALPPENNPQSNELYNLMYPPYEEGKGTLWYRDWDMFDMIILSGNFWTNKKGIQINMNEGNIFSEEWMMFTDSKGNSRPNRTASKSYYGGYSDHLPVYVDLIMQ
jgi:hypothetical protein